MRERRIEAKIAYVGPDSSGKKTNFDRIGEMGQDARFGSIEATRSDVLDTLGFPFRPTDAHSFRDCTVFVEVMSTREAAKGEAIANLLRRADGVVLVVDAHPSAQARNRESFEIVRKLQEQSARRVPVVLQVNKSDLPDALSSDEVVRGLHAEKLPHVVASATNGRGVVETIETIVTEVFTSMSQPKEAESAHSSDGLASNEKPSEGGHPLLSALRDVMRDTVRAHVDDLTTKFDERASENSEASVARVEERVARIEQRIEEKLEQRLARMEERFAGSEKTLQESIRAAEAQTRAHREPIAALKKSVDLLSVETKAGEAKTADLRAKITQLSEVASGLDSRVEASVEMIMAMAKRLDQIDTSTKATFTRVEAALATLVKNSSSAFDEVTGVTVMTREKVDGLNTRFDAVIEELKKPKKTWFT